MTLTALALKKARPNHKPYKISDNGGLFVLINPNGSKLWRWNYRFGGKQKTLALGSFPEVSLLDARIERDRQREILELGKDPARERKLSKEQVESDTKNTFKALSDEYLERQKRRNLAEDTYLRKVWLLNHHAVDLHDRPIKSLVAADILPVLQKAEKSGLVSTAHRLKSEISAVFRYAVTTLRAETDPTHILQGALESHEERHFAAITDLQPFRILLQSIKEYDGWVPLCGALKLIAYTAARPGVIRRARKCDFNLDERRWMVPHAHVKMRRQKNRQPFEIALSDQAVSVIEEMFTWDRRSELLFPSIRNNERPLSENSLNSALRRLGYTKHDHVAHGFRSSFSTIMNGLRFDAELIEVSLDHQESGVRRIYNRSNYWELRLKLMQDWADLIDDRAESKKQGYAHLLGM